MSDPSPLKKQKVDNVVKEDKDIKNSKNEETTSKQARIRIGTRKSQLAMWQANYVADLFQKAYPDISFDVVGLQTTGDRDQNTSLTHFTNKGIFTKELDIALLNNSIDVAVHCIKDLPTVLPEGLAMAAILERGPVQDVIVLHEKHKGKTLSELGQGTIIGTGALRRRAMLGRHFPNLVFKDIRGNLNTRLRKLDQGDYDGIMLARIGLERLGLGHRISQDLDVSKYGYAVGQGALGIITRATDTATQKLASILEHKLTDWACNCERGMLFTLEGGCKLPVVVRTSFREVDDANKEVNGKKYIFTLWGGVLTLDGKQLLANTVEKELNFQGKDQQNQAWQLGCELGKNLRSQGATEILAVITAKLTAEMEQKAKLKAEMDQKKDITSSSSSS